MCHSCRGCFLVCQDNAITEDDREIGIIESGWARSIEFVSGQLRVGEAMAIPLLKAVQKKAREDCLVIFDAPPGTSCPFVTTVSEAGYVILVTEPTPFGLYDLQLAVEVLQEIDIPHGVIINKAGIGDDRVELWCKCAGVDILLQIPFERSLAEAYARGKNLVDIRPDLRQSLEFLLKKVTL